MAVQVAGKGTKQLQEERATLIANARKLHEEHADDWTSDRDAQYNEMMSDASQLQGAVKRLNQLDSLDSPQPGQPSRQNGPTDVPGAGTDGANQDLTIMVRAGRDAQGRPRYIPQPVTQRGSADYRDQFASFLQNGQRSAALQSDSTTQAGYLVASEQFASEMLKEVDDLLFIRRYARIHTVPGADSLGIRKRTARASTFNWSPELVVSDEDTSLKYGKRVLTPHHMTGMIKLSRDLLRRSIIPVEGEVRGELARDAGEVMEDAYLTGTGDQQPLGVFTASTDGISTSRDVVTGSTTDFTADGILNAKYSLKGQYRRGERGSLRWLMSRTGINKVALLKDSNNQYLFRVGVGFAADNGMPEDRLLEIPVDESERAPSTFTDGNYVALLANWRYYEIADALDMEIQVLLEKYADTNQVGYIGRLKTDGMPTLEEAFVRMKCGT